MGVKFSLAFTTLQPTGKCKRNGHPHDEKEKREDKISGRPPVPVSMHKRRVPKVRTAVIVHEGHQHEGHPAKYIQRKQSFFRARRGRTSGLPRAQACIAYLSGAQGENWIVREWQSAR